MSDYERTSQICEFSRLTAILQVAIRQEAEEYDCGQVPTAILKCLETTSQRQQANIFTRIKNRLTGLPAPGAIQYSAAVVMPGWLIWAFTDWNSDSQATALSVRLDEAEISEYAYTHLVEDHGLNILGFSSGATERSLKFLGLGHGQDGEQFIHCLQQATQSAKAP